MIKAQYLFYVLLSELQRADLAGKPEEIDKAAGVLMVVKLACGKAGDIRVIERIGRGGTGFDDISLVKLELYFTGNLLLRTLDKGLYRFEKGSEPLSFIDDLGKF